MKVNIEIEQADIASALKAWFEQNGLTGEVTIVQLGPLEKGSFKITPKDIRPKANTTPVEVKQEEPKKEEPKEESVNSILGEAEDIKDEEVTQVDLTDNVTSLFSN